MSVLSVNTPLIPASADRFQAALTTPEPYEDPHRWKRIAAKASVIMISCTGNFLFIPVSLPVGKVLGPICAAGNFVTFLGLDYWSVQEIIQEAFDPRPPLALQWDQEQKQGCHNTGLTLIALAMSLLSQVANAFAAMKYNEGPYKIVAGGVILASGFLSYRSVLDSLRRAMRSSNDSAQFKEKVLEHINANRELFMRRGGPVLLSDMIQPPPISETNTFEKGADYAGIGVGLILTLFFEYATGDYTYVQAKDVCNNSVARGLLAAFTVLSSTYIIGQATLNTTRRIFNVAAQALTGNLRANISWERRPILSASLMALALVMNTAALGANLVIWNNFYLDNETKKLLFQGMVSATLWILFFTASLDIIAQRVRASLENAEFNRIEDLVKRCPPEELSLNLQQTVVLSRAI